MSPVHQPSRVGRIMRDVRRAFEPTQAERHARFRRQNAQLDAAARIITFAQDPAAHLEKELKAYGNRWKKQRLRELERKIQKAGALTTLCPECRARKLKAAGK